jgi:hypothetical protein
MSAYRASIVITSPPHIANIDQYAEAALGNREYFLNKPYGIGGGRMQDR